MTANSTKQETGNAARIALVSLDSLGDGLIYLMMADNPQRNGFSVTCYGNVAHQMRVWLPKLSIKPYPPAERLEAELEQYDLAIVSPPRFVRERLDDATIAQLREKWLLICQKTPDSWRFDHTERIRRSCSPRQVRATQWTAGLLRFHPVPQLQR